MKIRLKAISFDADFRFSEFGIYDTFRKSKKFQGDLRAGEAYLFVSGTGNQLLWVLNIGGITSKGANAKGSFDRRVIDTRRMRIEGRTAWHPMMLQNYANSVGLEIVGFKRFEEVYRG